MAWASHWAVEKVVGLAKKRQTGKAGLGSTCLKSTMSFVGSHSFSMQWQRGTELQNHWGLDKGNKFRWTWSVVSGLKQLRHSRNVGVDDAVGGGGLTYLEVRGVVEDAVGALPGPQLGKLLAWGTVVAEGWASVELLGCTAIGGL